MGLKLGWEQMGRELGISGWVSTPRHVRLLKSLLWHGARAEASGEVDRTQGRRAGTIMDQEEEDGGSASCDKVSRPRPPPTNSRTRE